MERRLAILCLCALLLLSGCGGTAETPDKAESARAAAPAVVTPAAPEPTPAEENTEEDEMKKPFREDMVAGELMPMETAVPLLDGPAYEAGLRRVAWSTDVLADLWHEAAGTHYLAISAVRGVPVVKIGSREELDAFRDAYGSALSRDGSFLDDETWDESWFAENVLLLSYVTAGSGSVRFFVRGLQERDGELDIILGSQAPEVGTADMAGWLVTVSVSAADAAAYTAFNACIKG